MRVMTTMILAASLSIASAAEARADLRSEKDINDGLLAIGIADEIRKNCAVISPRMIRAYRYMNTLESMAKARGYSDAEIEAYVTNKAEKAKMRSRGEAYLKAKGVQRSNPETFCDLGRAEIASNSRIGALLKAK
ncbi:DUF5333 domain-containing protein [Litorivita sp. NS0012-18]|uniref:DUF5333 domain-containing protein n=1 Tax=Litorivita sp. NS0012-18 TaxID=3127655 RepID=UPI0031049B20